MDEFVSVLELIDSDDVQAKKAIRDEVAEIQMTIRRTLDQGVSLDEARTLGQVRDAANAAEEVLEELL